jgi:uncharacterized protein YuzE
MASPTLSSDHDADAIYIRFSNRAIAETIELSEDVYVDIDALGDPVGIEILHAEPSLLAQLPESPASTPLRQLRKRESA